MGAGGAAGAAVGAGAGSAPATTLAPVAALTGSAGAAGGSGAAFGAKQAAETAGAPLAPDRRGTAEIWGTLRAPDALALDATLGAVREFVYRPNTFEPLALLRNANAPPFTTSMTPTAARSA